MAKGRNRGDFGLAPDEHFSSKETSIKTKIVSARHGCTVGQCVDRIQILTFSKLAESWQIETYIGQRD